MAGASICVQIIEGCAPDCFCAFCRAFAPLVHQWFFSGVLAYLVPKVTPSCAFFLLFFGCTGAVFLATLSNTYFKMRSVALPNVCMEVPSNDGDRPRLAPCSSSDNQKLMAEWEGFDISRWKVPVARIKSYTRRGFYLCANSYEAVWRGLCSLADFGQNMPQGSEIDKGEKLYPGASSPDPTVTGVSIDRKADLSSTTCPPPTNTNWFGGGGLQHSKCHAYGYDKFFSHQMGCALGRIMPTIRAASASVWMIQPRTSAGATSPLSTTSGSSRLLVWPIPLPLPPFT